MTEKKKLTINITGLIAPLVESKDTSEKEKYLASLKNKKKSKEESDDDGEDDKDVGKKTKVLDGEEDDDDSKQVEEQLQFWFDDEIAESLGNLQLVKPLINTLRRNASVDAFDGKWNGRGGSSLSTLGSKSPTESVIKLKIPTTIQQREAYLDALSVKDNKERSPEQIAALNEFATVRLEFSDAFDKAIRKGVRKTGPDGLKSFAFVVVVDQKTVGMLWNAEMGFDVDGAGKSDKFVISKVGYENANRGWMYARTDGYWQTTKEVRQRNYGANRSKWDKWSYVQVPTLQAGRDDIALNVGNELALSNPGSTVEIVAIYPDVESFKLAQERKANKQLTPEEDAKNLQKSLSSDAVDKIYKKQLDNAIGAYKKQFESVYNATIKSLDSDTDRNTSMKVSARIQSLTDGYNKLRHAKYIIDNMKENLSRKQRGQTIYTSYTQEELDKVLSDLQFLTNSWS